MLRVRTGRWGSGDICRSGRNDSCLDNTYRVMTWQKAGTVCRTAMGRHQLRGRREALTACGGIHDALAMREGTPR